MQAMRGIRGRVLSDGSKRFALRSSSRRNDVLDLVTIHAQGMTYGTQSSVFETGIDDTLSLNSVMFRHDYSGIASVLDVVKCTDGAVLALSQFVRNLVRLQGIRESPRKQRNKFENGHMRILMGCS